MVVNFYTSAREYKENQAEFDGAIHGLLQSGITTLGNAVADLEASVCRYTGAKYAVGVASGSDALDISAKILGFGSGDEVITSPFTFISTASCIVKSGAKPVFADIDPDTFNLNAAGIGNFITKKTKGVIPVHLFMQMADMDAITDLAGANGIKILEDSAQAFGMRWIGRDGIQRHSGTIGACGIFSFFPTKTLGAYGDGGMIVTNDAELYNLARLFRVHGAAKKYHYDYIGFNSRLDTLQAAILSVKLKHVDDAIAKRAKAAALYRGMLSNCGSVTIPAVKGRQRPVDYVFNILARDRDGLKTYLASNGIQTCVYYPLPLHLQKCLAGLGYKKGDFPVAERISEQILALPVYPEITADEIEYVSEKILQYYK